MKQHIKIGVIGGTGKSGKYLVKQLLKEGYKIKLLVRPSSNFKIDTAQIETVKGDVTDFESVKKLVEGCQALIT